MGCYGGSWGGCYGTGWGGGRSGGYVLGGASPMIGGSAYSPMIANYGTPIAGANGTIVMPGMTQSFYGNPALPNNGNEATILVHMPENANLTIDGQPTQSRSSTRIFHSPPLEPGKVYTYTLRAEMNRDGQPSHAQTTIEVRAGQRSEVNLNFDNANRADNQTNSNVAPADDSGNRINPARSRRTPPADTVPGTSSFPTPPRDR
jgi:uncharacterized protein (TIGR03000 family)